jgi:hypothetical protein
MLILIILLVIVMCMICPHDNSNDGFWLGYLCGSGGRGRNKTYCD